MSFNQIMQRIYTIDSTIDYFKNKHFGGKGSPYFEEFIKELVAAKKEQEKNLEDFLQADTLMIRLYYNIDYYISKVRYRIKKVIFDLKEEYKACL